MKFADLHVHTNYSDSTFTPAEVITAAYERGLAAVAISDHDNLDGIEPCRSFACEQAIPVEVIPAIELTAEKDATEIHILGYFIDEADAAFRKRLTAIRNGRISRIERMVERLAAEGIEIRAADVFKLAGPGSVGRLHLARELLRTGMIKTTDEAFRKYIGYKKPCYVPNVHFTPREAIGLIREKKGVAVLAHPYTMHRDDLIPEFVDEGLQGIEVDHTDHDPASRRRYAETAKRFGLITTGGSDCHGLNKGRILIGTVRVPYTVVDALRRASGSR